jgi:hypothetical protein
MISLETNFEIILTYHSKDLETFKYSVYSIKKNFPNVDIQVLSSITNKNYIESFDCIFIDENIIGGKLKSRLLTQKNGGWYLQQILKLYFAKLVKTDFYFVIDSDTVILNNFPLFDSGIPILTLNKSLFQPYSNGNEILLGYKYDFEFSFISHQIIFEKKYVIELIEEIQLFTNEDWIESIIKICELKDPLVSFSEFETYGNFLRKKSAPFNIRFLNSIDLPLKPNKFLIWLFSFKFTLVSFHKYSWKNDGIFKTFLKYIKYLIILLSYPKSLKA